MVVTVNIGTLENRILLEVHGRYSPYRAGSREDPPEDETFEIEKVIYSGATIDQILECVNFDYSELEKRCLEEIKD